MEQNRFENVGAMELLTALSREAHLALLAYIVKTGTGKNRFDKPTNEA